MMVGELLIVSDLDSQQGIFKLIMKSNVAMCMALPFDLNPLTKMCTKKKKGVLQLALQLYF